MRVGVPGPHHRSTRHTARRDRLGEPLRRASPSWVATACRRARSTTGHLQRGAARPTRRAAWGIAPIRAPPRAWVCPGLVPDHPPCGAARLTRRAAAGDRAGVRGHWARGTRRSDQRRPRHAAERPATPAARRGGPDSEDGRRTTPTRIVTARAGEPMDAPEDPTRGATGPTRRPPGRAAPTRGAARGAVVPRAATRSTSSAARGGRTGERPEDRSAGDPRDRRRRRSCCPGRGWRSRGDRLPLRFRYTSSLARARCKGAIWLSVPQMGHSSRHRIKGGLRFDTRLPLASTVCFGTLLAHEHPAPTLPRLPPPPPSGDVGFHPGPGPARVARPAAAGRPGLWCFPSLVPPIQ